ncbi:PAS domain-containing protein [Bacteroides luti]|uniref:histidine kinase n=1 Tax=Bacteroides luti TaxID=1297750 RepID=A0A1M5GIE4_9BACE|nr:ATP-binding protein [Bacteroides luti]SHG03446.1 PAS domain-containing protein [Bacteroides luti]
MKVKSLFWIFAFLLLVILSLLTSIVVQKESWMFYLVEGLIVVAIFLLIVFYKKIVKPLNTIGNGMDLLREQDFSSRLSPVGQYEADRVVNIFNRMMEQLKNERIRLREQNNFLDLLIKASPMGVIILNFDEKITSLNPAAIKVLGIHSVEEVANKKLQDIDSLLAEELATLSFNDIRTVQLNDSNIYKCTYSSFIDQGFQHPFILIESLTDEVMKAEKKAYEKVIRMIAHEVNNTTAGITSTLDTVESTLTEVENTEDIREVMRVCIDRCFSMSRFITNFADVVKIPEPDLRRQDLNTLVNSCKMFMENICHDRDISITLRLSENLNEVMVDASLFEQVMVNIIKNSAESIESQGEIIITTTNNPICLEVADNGKGINKETAAKLFSPFFSTKPEGQGIGLIFIREVLLKHGCTFSLRTYDDGLTRFRILFE